MGLKYLSVVVWHQTNVKPPTSVLEQLTKRLSDTVQILTAFLFHSPHHVALRTYDPNHVFATTRSSNCQFSIPVEGSYWITFSLGSFYVYIS